MAGKGFLVQSASGDPDEDLSQEIDILSRVAPMVDMGFQGFPCANLSERPLQIEESFIPARAPRNPLSAAISYRLLFRLNLINTHHRW